MAAAELAALAPGPAEASAAAGAGAAPAGDARLAVPIGPRGEVYEPDGAGAWTLRTRVTTAARLTRAARVGGAVVALGEGVVYRLAPNGWSGIRIAQQSTAKLAIGDRAVAAVGARVYALDRLAGGEPALLGVAPAPIRMIGSGASIVVATDRGLWRLTGGRSTPISWPALRAPRGAPVAVRELVGDRWAVVEGGAIDLRSGARVSWPSGLEIEVVAVAPEDGLAAVARRAGGLELLAAGGRGGGAALTRAPIPLAVGDSAAVGVAVDRAGRAVLALQSGALLVRAGPTAPWTAAQVARATPPARPGVPPARSQ